MSEEILFLISKLLNNFYIILIVQPSNILAGFCSVFLESCFSLLNRSSCAHCYNLHSANLFLNRSTKITNYWGLSHKFSYSLTSTAQSLSPSLSTSIILLVTTNLLSRYQPPFPGVCRNHFLNSNGYGHG